MPWSTDVLWHEAQDALRYSLSHGPVRMAAARQSADRLAHQLGLLDGLFEQLAVTTCNGCPDPCCDHAKVWLDFQDLLFIHLHHETLPSHQLRRNLREPCRFLGLHGCRLPRLSRPWICTWYICPTQRQVLERDVPGGMVQITAMLSRVKFLRKEMEQRFMTALGLTPAV
ncbi:MAG: hypothetical protein KQI78_24205 [Deltaproteobacteria bacterium]|nr:hypothetical protein [Deltaproteobacteria bacterium]